MSYSIAKNARAMLSVCSGIVHVICFSAGIVGVISV